jgi:tRNA pseudouridine55 synthase
MPNEGVGPPSGLLLIDKPAGITSHDAVDRVRRHLGVRKVGHAGTLDPPATGLLLVGVGRATRLLRFLGDLPKTYVGTGVLGVETDTLDAAGTAVRESPVSADESRVREAMARFVGDIQQTPPAYSAVKVKGERSYRAARRGESLDIKPRIVHVDRFDLTGFDSPRFDFEVLCSSGTYVRTLVADVGRELGSGAYLARLRRTAIGPFLVKDASPPDDPRPLLGLDRAVEHLAAVSLQAEEAEVAVHGCCLGPAGIAGPYRALAPDGRLIGIYRDAGTKAVPEVILTPG